MILIIRLHGRLGRLFLILGGNSRRGFGGLGFHLGGLFSSLL